MSSYKAKQGSCNLMPTSERHAASMQLALAVVGQSLQRFGDCRGPFEVAKSFFLLLIARFVRKIFAPQSRCHVIVRRPENMRFWALCFRGGNPQILEVHFQVWPIFEHVAKFG